jgi:3-hydroxyisobutyrate dehydrogenase-like beta-hydroxyacid dehydrogenase
VQIAVLGMGRMGRAIARRLLDGGHPVRVWNRSAGKTTEVVSAGGREAGSIGDALNGADVVITMLADDAAVRAVAFGELQSSISDTSVYIDCSTVSPRISGELAAAFSGRFLALPVLGSPLAVEAGRARYLAGGGRDVVERVTPVLASLSTTVRHYDTAPMAATAKLANNLLLLSEVVALAEAFTVGRSGGLTDEQLRELLGESPLVPPGLKNRFDTVLTGSPDRWWTTVLGAKDAGLAIDVARGADVDLPAARTVQRLYEKAAESGLEEADIAAVTRIYQHPTSP